MVPGARSGSFITNLSGELAYQSFRPALLPPDPPLLFDGPLSERVGSANRHLAELDAMSRFIPSVDLFISSYVRKEALMSSQIEGAQCTLDDVLDPESEGSANADVAEVVNYVRAMRSTIEDLSGLPLCNHLLRRAHAVLMRGVRGEDKTPGEFRRSQNWVGPAGCTLREARYVPPNVEDMYEAMGRLETYLNSGDANDPIVRAALIHYQFETIHPFLDGNGRVGRLLILLFLMQEGLLHKPVLYPSYFLKRNQWEYYDRMTRVRETGDYEQWVGFFVEAVDAAAVDASQAIGSLVELHDANLGKIAKTGRALKSTERVFTYLEQQPIIDIGRTARALGVSYNTVSGAVRRLEALDIVTERTNAQRNRVFAYDDYLAVLRRGTE